MKSSIRIITGLFLTAVLFFTLSCGQMTDSEKNQMIAEQSVLDGLSCLSVGDTKGAVSNLQTAVSLNPNDKEASNALDWITQLLAEEGKNAMASEPVLSEEDPEADEDALNELMLFEAMSAGLEAFEDGDYELMLDALDTALDFTKLGTEEYFDAAKIRMAALNLNAEYDECMDQADELLEIDPTDLDVLTSSGWAAHHAGYDEDSLGFVQTAYDLYPDNPTVLNNLAYAWAIDGENLDKAYDFVKLALDAEPEHPAFLDTMGWILYQKGDPQAALPYIEDALGGAFTDQNNKEVQEHYDIIMEELSGNE